jgi:dolichol-phosphate mannosyltransferase
MSLDLAPLVASLKGPILVTGASGFLGANLMKTLRRYRQDVVGVARTRSAWRLLGMPTDSIARIDLLDSEAVKKLSSSLHPKTIFHLATYGAYASQSDISLILESNLQGTLNLIRSLDGTEISAFVNAGSSSEYGNNSAGPTESTMVRPNSYYSFAKGILSNLLHLENYLNGLPAVNLRLSSVYGPYEDTSRLIPNLLRAGLSKNFPPLVSATTTRDFVFVDDVIEAFLLAGLSSLESVFGKDINIGSGKATSVGQLVTLSKDLFNISTEPNFETMESRSWDVPLWFADNSLADSLLKWKPRTRLEDGLKKTSEWIETLSDDEFLKFNILYH